MNLRIRLSLLALVFALGSMAQSTTDEKYRTEAEAMRQEVWAWKKPEFAERNVPAEFAGASKVIIARHRELNAESKSRVAYLGITFAVRKTQQITNIFRELVKLNDKTAVEEYSEVNFTMLSKSSLFIFKSKSTTYVGIRIIKPDGSIKEYKGDDMVLTQNSANNKKAKLAIPNLAPGDVLDYFIATVDDVSASFSDERYNLYLYEESPIMHLSFHGLLGKKYAVEYRSYNGAPTLDVNKNEEEDIEISLAAKNIPAYRSTLWVSTPRQLPFIRLTIALGYKGMGSTLMGTRKPGVVSKNTPANEVVDRLASRYSVVYFNTMVGPNKSGEWDVMRKDMQELSRKNGKPWKEMTDEEKADYAFYYLRYQRLQKQGTNHDKVLEYGNEDYNAGGLDFFGMLKALKMDAAIVVAPGFRDVRANEVMEFSDFNSAVRPEEVNKVYEMHSIFSMPGDLSQDLEGVDKTFNMTFDKSPTFFTPSGMAKLATVTPGAPIKKLSGADDNVHTETLGFSIDGSGQLLVNRRATLSGHYKHGAQARLILFEEYLNDERKQFGEKIPSYLDYLADEGKKERLLGEELTAVFAEARKKQKKAFEDDAKDWFETTEVSNISNIKIENLGTRHTAPAFTHSSQFVLGGLVKKAGNNMILEIGRLQGAPSALKPEQRQRGNLDVYMPFARTIRYEVSLALPAGYSAAGIEALNKKVENASGHFISTATQAGNEVKISISRRYNNRFEPAANWPQLLAILDAGDEFQNAKLLLKKG